LKNQQKNYQCLQNVVGVFLISVKISKFAFNVNYLNMDNTKNINRLKAVLADANQTNKWLAEQLGKDPVTVSKWCTNTTQPDLQTLLKIAELLNVDIRELLISTAK
jgi:DNA-binding XRE family transcriptional regulator